MLYALFEKIIIDHISEPDSQVFTFLKRCLSFVLKEPLY